MENKSKELEIALLAAQEAGLVLEKYFETEVLKEYKEDKSIVTLADKESEEVIKKIILKDFPDHSVLGEETGMTENHSEYVWYIDPVDGTKNFSNGIPLFAVSIALAEKNELKVGVIYNPAARTIFYAELGKGAYFNDKRIYVSKDDQAHSIVTVASGKKPNDLALRRALMHDLPENLVPSVRDFGCTAIDLSYLARGSTEADIKFNLHPYDFAAGILIAKEAGAVVTKIDGSPWKFPEDNSYVASNGLFHEVLVEEIKRQKQELGIE